MRKSTLIAMIVLAILAVIIIVSRCTDFGEVDECTERGGQWDYYKKDCVFK